MTPNTSTLNRAYYQASSESFLRDTQDQILGELTRAHAFALEDLQKNAWISEVEILKSALIDLPNSHVAFEYAIPRMGKRVDVVVLYEGIVFVIEFKVGESDHSKTAHDQVLDYSVDLKNFHEGSHSRSIVPVLVATEAQEISPKIEKYPDDVYYTINANRYDLANRINDVVLKIGPEKLLNPTDWINANYKPTPTIIQAAQALYKGHSVEEISRSDAGVQNLSLTSLAIGRIIEKTKTSAEKAICFITGVPGSGKTLAGLNIVNDHNNVGLGEHAVFLSGNGPLVEVLREALAREEVQRKKGSETPITKKDASRKASTFIQNIHHFRDDSLQSNDAPIEHVAMFDEAQRAWTKEQTKSFMSRKKGISDFDMSEPEFLISVLDRHTDWATIICLIGGGQEINTGEGGLQEWFSAIGKKYSNWKVYASGKLVDDEYTGGADLYSLLHPTQLSIEGDLHLAVSVRSYRSERVASFVKAVLDNDPSEARRLIQELNNKYPIVVSRDLQRAKDWIKKRARGSEGLGLVASSGAYRLKPYGIHIKSSIDPKIWFLNDGTDVRSAGFLEEVATEFDIQGLELDWTCVAWDADLRRSKESWEYKKFSGTKWSSVRDLTRQKFLLNSYRVLLTRARQGMVIFVPKGDSRDETRDPQFYDPIHEYLCQCGITVID